MSPNPAEVRAAEYKAAIAAEQWSLIITIIKVKLRLIKLTEEEKAIIRLKQAILRSRVAEARQ